MEFNIFSCYKCKHAQIKDSKQVGCDLGHLQFFMIQNKAEILNDDYFYSLGRVCLSKDDNTPRPEKDVRLGYLFILDDETKIEQLIKNIDLIKDKDPLWIGVVHSFSNSHNTIVDAVKPIGCKYNIILNYESAENIYKPDQFMNNYLNGWTLVNVVGQPFKFNAKEILSNFVFEQSGVAGAILENIEENVNNACFFNIIYKTLKGSKIDFDEDGNLLDFRFIEKIINNNPNMIKYWKDLECH